MNAALPQRSSAGQLTIFVPTRNEQESIIRLFDELSSALTVALQGTTDVVVIDDSNDATPDYVRGAIARGVPGLNIRLIHREPAQRAGGLGGAVMWGLAHANVTTKWVVLMDADLQHPPMFVPDLLRAAEAIDADLVVGSRYIRGGRNDGLGFVRTLVSRRSTVAAKAVFPVRLREISDPMSGFFLFRPEAIAPGTLERGFKILLALAASNPDWVKTEVPITFVEREAGTSKGTLKEGFRYLQLLAELRWSLRPQRTRRSLASEPDIAS